MKKLFYTAVILTLVSGATSIATPVRTVTTITPIPNMGYGTNYGFDNYPKVSQMEQIVFGMTFQQEDIYNRLSRLESRIFNRTNQNLDLAQRMDIITSQVAPTSMYNISPNELASIEAKLFNRTYVNDDPETRVIRIEKEMLGAIQPGDLNERYEVIAKAAKHYNAFPANTYVTQGLQQPYIAAANTGGGKGLLKNILSTLVGGALTGFTPPITDPYGYCSSPYINAPYGTNTTGWSQGLFPGSGSGFNDYMQSNNGYYNYNKNYGTGSGVNVLYD